MKKAKSFLYLTQLNTRRIFRDFKYVLLIIALPMFFYVIYSEIFPQNAAVNGISWKEYSLISLICFGIMGNAINLLGTKVANEKNDNWYAYLKVSVINPNAYMMSYLFSYFLISFIFSVAMILLGYFYNDIHIAFYKLVEIVILLNVFSFAFLFLALIIGQSRFSRAADRYHCLFAFVFLGGYGFLSMRCRNICKLLLRYYLHIDTGILDGAF
ncbi:ABC transporter permease [Staphylococcus pseudintermedius]